MFPQVIYSRPIPILSKHSRSLFHHRTPLHIQTKSLCSLTDKSNYFKAFSNPEQQWAQQHSTGEGDPTQRYKNYRNTAKVEEEGLFNQPNQRDLEVFVKKYATLSEKDKPITTAADNPHVSVFEINPNTSSGSSVPPFCPFDVTVIPDFLPRDRVRLLEMEIHSKLRRRKYNNDHWDMAITGFREVEPSEWDLGRVKGLQELEKGGGGVEELRELRGVYGEGANGDTLEAVRVVLQRIEDHVGEMRRRSEEQEGEGAVGPPLKFLPRVHLLDLAADGYILPHIDSKSYCGRIIACVNLFSPAIITLDLQEDVRQGEEGYEEEDLEGKLHVDRFIKAQRIEDKNENKSGKGQSSHVVKIHCEPNSLYVLRGRARTHYRHSVVEKEWNLQTAFPALAQLQEEGSPCRIQRRRRVSVLLREDP
eukprot:Nk52_evm6s230 gene=Nk52_evmTU6s230